MRTTASKTNRRQRRVGGRINFRVWVGKQRDGLAILEIAARVTWGRIETQLREYG